MQMDGWFVSPGAESVGKRALVEAMMMRRRAVEAIAMREIATRQSLVMRS